MRNVAPPPPPSTSVGLPAERISGRVDQDPRPFRERRLGWVVVPLGVDIASRLGTLLVVVSISHGDRTGVPSLLSAWDGRWFLLAAQHGYPSSLPVVFGNAAQSTLGFFPVFPVLISLMHLATTIGYESAAIMGQ